MFQSAMKSGIWHPASSRQGDATKSAMEESSLPSVKSERHEPERAARVNSRNVKSAGGPSLVGRTADRLLRLIAADPTDDSLISIGARFGLDFLPFAGPIKKFADARELFRTGDSKLMGEARSLALISMLEMGIDVGGLVLAPATGGTSLLFPDEALTTLRNVRDTVRRLTGGRISIPDPLSVVTWVALRVSPLRNRVDKILQFGM